MFRLRHKKPRVLLALPQMLIRVITKLPNSEQSYKGKVKTHNYINRKNQSTTENCENRNDPEVKGIKVRTVIKIRDNPGTKIWPREQTITINNTK